MRKPLHFKNIEDENRAILASIKLFSICELLIFKKFKLSQEEIESALWSKWVLNSKELRPSIYSSWSWSKKMLKHIYKKVRKTS